MDCLELYFKLKSIGVIVCVGFVVFCTAFLTIGDYFARKDT